VRDKKKKDPVRSCQREGNGGAVYIARGFKGHVTSRKTEKKSIRLIRSKNSRATRSWEKKLRIQEWARTRIRKKSILKAPNANKGVSRLWNFRCGSHPSPLGVIRPYKTWKRKVERKSSLTLMKGWPMLLKRFPLRKEDRRGKKMLMRQHREGGKKLCNMEFEGKGSRVPEGRKWGLGDNTGQVLSNGQSLEKKKRESKNMTAKRARTTAEALFGFGKRGSQIKS